MRLLAFGFLIHFLRHGMVFPLIPLYAQSLGALESRIGLVVASFHLLSLFVAIPMGGLVERFGIRTMLTGGVICNLLYSLLLMAANSLWVLVLAQVAGGMGFLLLIISTQTYIGSQERERDRERGFGLITLTAAVGQTLGPALGGFLLSYAGYAWVFRIAVVLALLGFVSVAVRDPRSGSTAASTKRQPTVGQIRDLLRNRHLVYILLFTFSVMVVVSLRGSFLPVLLQAKGIDEGQIGVLLSCFALAMTLVRVGVGRILGWTSRLNVLIFTLVCVIVGSGTVPMLDSPLVLAVSLAVFGMGFGLSQPLSMVMISDVSGSGQAMGLRFFTITAGNFLSAIGMGWVAEVFSLSTAFYLGAGFLLLSGLLIVLKIPALEQR